MAHENAQSVIEKLLGFDFVSDPRKAKTPIPEAPEGHPSDRPYFYPAQVFTPSMAKDILKYRVIRFDVMPKKLQHDEMTANRRFLIGALKGSRHRKGLIQVLLDKEWNPRIATPVVFTEDGFLLDGQHRFAACALSGVPIEVPVAVQGQWDTFTVTDTGTGRNAGQLLGEVPYPDYSAAAAKLILPTIKGTERTNWSDSDAPNQDIYDLVHGWPFFHESWSNGGSWMKEVVQASASRVPLSPLAASTMMALAAGADPFHVQSFLTGLKPSYRDGFPEIGDRANDPRWMLRNVYLNKPSGTRVSDKQRRQQVGHVRQAMQIWLEYQSGSQIIRLTKLPTVPSHQKLPEVWHADRVREFHREAVS